MVIEGEKKKETQTPTRQSGGNVVMDEGTVKRVSSERTPQTWCKVYYCMRYTRDNKDESLARVAF